MNVLVTIQVVQMFNQIIPVLSIMPHEIIRVLLHRVVLNGVLNHEHHVVEKLRNHIGYLQEKYPDDRIVLTGHSIGGGIAQIVAGQLELPALVFSAPGVFYSKDQCEVHVQAIKRNVVVIVPNWDLVPRIDVQAGVVQAIECRTKDGNQDTAADCHSLLKTGCELWRVCGDAWHRDFSDSCTAFVSEKQLGAYM